MIAGATVGYLFKNAGSNLKIDGINQGSGSFMSVFKGNVTKATKKEVDGWIKEKIGDVIGDDKVKAIDSLYKAWKNLGKNKAMCSMTC